MKTIAFVMSSVVFLSSLGPGTADPAQLCQNYGPQTPRDIASKDGSNAGSFPIAPAAASLNLCNIHFHASAEHKGPGFLQPVVNAHHSAGHGGSPGYQCNAASALTPAELQTPAGEGACKGLKPGDTIEAHWVHSSCAISPGKGLASCSSPSCGNPTLRVESQVFLVVNDPKALDFATFDYSGNAVKGLHQAKSLPEGGLPVVFRGSTTGPDYTEQKCSPLQATWSVRPNCAKVDIGSLNAWCSSNVFKENHGHGIRPLVTAPALLDKIQ
jgi:hypothetical protein